ncbi:glycosyltransferase [Agromyces sp. CFH 90414]|uniref:Glycosyltransferase n=1 Tax=Agromyces agglutinans TaxID=2662258 RepID=A0A6I2F758_9MICO|nr:glycosyltransferase family 2 protein [Agromyces agglutinans]MRG60094.1 glycosyltransferase [Agromyces agglutinans]
MQRSESMATVVVNYGSSRLLEANLADMAGSGPVIVVDNPTTRAERERVHALAARHGWDIVDAPSNLGFGGGVNLGAARAFDSGAAEILVLNPDARIDAEAVRALRRAVTDDRMSLVSPRVVDPDGKTWFAGLDLVVADGTIRSPRRRAEFPDDHVVEWLSGACLLVTAEVWKASGGFDDEYFLYWEDVDFSRRVTDAGGRLRVVHDAVAIHDEGGTQRDGEHRSQAKSELYYYFNIRNRMLYAARHLDAAAVRSWQRSSVRAARAVLLRGGRRQFLRPVAPIRAAWRGLRDGRRIADAALAGSPLRAGQYTPSTTHRKATT